LQAGLVAAADDVIDRYRNSSNFALDQFDWRKAQICLEHAAELDGSDTAVKGNLALSNAYLALLESPQTEQTAARAKAGFEEAHSYLSRSPDPHLGLARITFITSAILGARWRNCQTPNGWASSWGLASSSSRGWISASRGKRAAAGTESNPEACGCGQVSGARAGDMDRARNLYEPIDGYSNVGSNLKRLDRDRDRLQVLLARNEKPIYARKMPRRPRTWR